MVRPAQRPGVDREDRKQRGRGRCISLELSVCNTEGNPARFRYSAISCLTPLAGDADPYSWECVCSFIQDWTSGGQWVTFSIYFQKNLKRRFFASIVFTFEKNWGGQLPLPTLPKPNIHPILPRPAIRSSSSGIWNSPKTNMTIRWIAQVMHKWNSQLLK